MMPGMSGANISDDDIDKGEAEFKLMEVIIHSMTIEERRDPNILNASRRKRIAAGSGTTVTQVNNVIKKYNETKKMVKKVMKPGGMKKSGLRGLF